MTHGLKYLTVQDVLWVNLQVAKRVNHSQYQRLEEATYYQYAYGASHALLPQAARFLNGFTRLAPFEGGNAATAFVSALAFLSLNGREIRLKDADAAQWLSDILEKRVAAQEALTQATREPDARDDHHEEDLAGDPKAHITRVIQRFPLTLRELMSKS